MWNQSNGINSDNALTMVAQELNEKKLIGDKQSFF